MGLALNPSTTSIRFFLLLAAISTCLIFARNQAVGDPSETPPPSSVTTSIPRFCNSAREFEKAYVYLTKKNEIQMIESQAIQLAVQISEGCDGALDRFNKVFQVMRRSGIEFTQCKDLALKFSQKSDAQVDTFVEFYKKTFLENYFDLDFLTAYKISQKFAEKTAEETYGLARDFERIVNFCLHQKKMGLPLKTCADYAFELADYRYLWGQKSMSKDLEDMYDFVLTREDLDYTTLKFLKWSRRVLQFGPGAVENFKLSYEFLRRQNMLQSKAVELAVRVASNSLEKKQQP